MQATSRPSTIRKRSKVGDPQKRKTSCLTVVLHSHTHTERGITINATGIALEFPEWNSLKHPGDVGLSIGLIDSPGHADFNGEVQKKN